MFQKNDNHDYATKDWLVYDFDSRKETHKTVNFEAKHVGK